MKKIRVLVVDDSNVVRKLLSELINREPDMEVVGVACDGAEAMTMFMDLVPDVITMDIQMPNVDGLSALEQIINHHPTPVIMISKLVQSESNVALKALDLGAFDFLSKPCANDAARDLFRLRLAEKVRNAASVDIQKLIARRRKAGNSGSLKDEVETYSCLQLSDKLLNKKCVAIGISTGGPPALNSLLSKLRRPMPPIFIVQHMPATFTASFAKRLDQRTDLKVVEASDGELVCADTVYVAPGSDHMLVGNSSAGIAIHLNNDELVHGHRPAVDLMMASVAEVYGNQCLGVIMTGMGRDGVAGCQSIKEAGGLVLGQDQESSDVYGMNKLAFDFGSVDQQFHLVEGPELITRFICKGSLALT